MVDMPPDEFDLASAQEAAHADRLEDWVQAYLVGPGRNQAFADGLRHRLRWWTGPWLLPLHRLERTCGPEQGMRFPVPLDSWRQRVSAIAASFERLERFPPLIAEYHAGRLLLNDGSHRYAAFATLGLAQCWVLVWYPDESQWDHHERQGFAW